MQEIEFTHREVSSFTSWNEGIPTFHNKYDAKMHNKSSYSAIFNQKILKEYKTSLTISDKTNIGKKEISIYLTCIHKKRFIASIPTRDFKQYQSAKFLIRRSNKEENCRCGKKT